MTFRNTNTNNNQIFFKNSKNNWKIGEIHSLSPSFANNPVRIAPKPTPI